MWRFWLYRTADTFTSSSAPAAEVSWKYLGADPLTKIDLSEASNYITVSTSLKATTSPVKWVRKAGVYGLEDASPLNDEVLQAVAARLQTDPSVYIRSVAVGTLGCLGRRAIATRVGESLVPACLDALVQSLSREENRLCIDQAQGRSIKFGNSRTPTIRRVNLFP